MKRIIMLLIAAGLIIASWFLLPAVFVAADVAYSKAPIKGAFRVFGDTSNWKKWWPGEKAKGQFTFNGRTYRPVPVSFTEIAVAIGTDAEGEKESVLSMNRYGADSIEIRWNAAGAVKTDYWSRVKGLFTVDPLKKDMNTILHAFTSSILDTKKIFGFDVNLVNVKDTLLIATKARISHYPLNADVDILRNRLMSLLRQQNIPPSGFVMLNVTPIDAGFFQVQVAIPVLKEPVVNGKDIYIKRMILGKLLEAEVRGGYFTIRQGVSELDNYVNDYGFVSPAIPFQSLVTDRTAEGDTSKWITKLYYPVY